MNDPLDPPNSHDDAPAAATFVGVAPWLPWPLSALPSWTEPVRAERFAAWRIGVAACLFIDFLWNYVAHTLDFWSKDGIGDPALFDYKFTAERLMWSLLRGVGDPTLVYLSLSIWITMSVWIAGNAFSWLLWMGKGAPRPDRTGVALWIWCAAYAWYVLGFWSRSLEAGPFDALAWVVPLIGFSLACLFHAMDIAARLRDPAHRVPWLGLVFSMCMTIALTGIGFALTKMEPPDKDAIWVQLLGPWQKLDAMVIAAMAVFLTAMVMMMLGFATRFATIVTWMLSMSFANSNPYLDNAGDTIRSILLFYLIFCPCGAAWSIDALIARRKGRVYVPPWPIQLMLIQMCFIYLMNGMYKLLGASWVEGFSMHYVLGDLVLTRFSPMMVPLPPQLAKLMTWSVVAWEVSFPVLVIWKWPRRVALLLGAMFHLGIFATLELGGFVPYALCMYLPFLPWGGWERAEELNTLK